MTTLLIYILTPVLAVSLMSAGPASSNARSNSAPDRKVLVYIGTYTQRGSKGIYLSELDTKTGELTTPSLAAETKDPTFLAIHPNHKFLYAANEIDNFQGRPEGAVTAYSIDSKTGNLTLINQQSSRGKGPCHLIVDRSGSN